MQNRWKCTLSGGFNRKNDENILWSGDFIDIKPMKTYQNSISSVPPLDILTVYASTLNRSFINIRCGNLRVHQKHPLESRLQSANLSMQKQRKRTYIHSRLVVPLPFWLCLFAIVSSYCFNSEIPQLMFLSQTLTTSWHLVQFPIAYLWRPFR